VVILLIDSLDDGPSEEGEEEAWMAEIERRVEDLRSRKAHGIPWEEVQRLALARLRDAKGEAASGR
jgi:putative addiction module component (TIGR02574 family)